MPVSRYLGGAIGACCLVIVAACTGSESGGLHVIGTATPASVSASTGSATEGPAPHESTVRAMLAGGTERFGWVESSAKAILTTFYPPGSGPFIGGRRVNLKDRIIVVKMYGKFDHSAPPGAKSSATLALAFYDLSTHQDLGFRQMWDGIAPDLGVGANPWPPNRQAGAQWWDLRLLGTPTVRSM
jgi:hypothetical protein